MKWCMGPATRSCNNLVLNLIHWRFFKQMQSNQNESCEFSVRIKWALLSKDWLVWCSIVLSCTIHLFVRGDVGAAGWGCCAANAILIGWVVTMEQGCLWADIAAPDVDHLPGFTWRVSWSCEVVLVVVVWLSGIWGGVVQGHCLAVVVPCVMGGRYAVGIPWWVSWFTGFQCGCRSVQSQSSRLVSCIF